MKKTFFLATLIVATNVFANTCEELPVGESFVRDMDYKESPTGVEQKYGLFRESLDTYEVIVNPKFIGDTRESERAMAERVSACLETEAFKYTEKKDIKLKFKLFDESDKSKFLTPPPMVPIEIVGTKNRANSGAYPVNINCITVLHEVLHLTGLVDEYKEYYEDGIAKYPNRSYGPANSIMSDMGVYLIFGLKTKAKFYPAHIRQILHPDCAEMNSLYQTCSQGAYRYIADKEKPKACKKKSWVN